jgi:hypothetical protein
MTNVRRFYAIGVSIAAVILIGGPIRPVHASVLDCVSGPLGTGNPSNCTEVDRKHYEELQKQADAEAQAVKATTLYCINNPTAPSDKCPDEYRKIIDKNDAARKAKQQREYEVGLQGAETRKQEVKSKQEALLRQELAENEKQFRAAARQESEAQERRNAERFKEQQAAYQRDVDESIGRISQFSTELATQRAQQQAVEEQTRRVTQRVQHPAASVPARSDPLAPAPAPSQTPESRRAAGLPDDPNAAACIQDDDCARAVLHGGNAAPKP